MEVEGRFGTPDSFLQPEIRRGELRKRLIKFWEASCAINTAEGFFGRFIEDGREGKRQELGDVLTFRSIRAVFSYRFFVASYSRYDGSLL